MDRTGSVIRLHAQNRCPYLVLPLLAGLVALGIVLLIGAIATASMGAGVADMREGMRWNGAIWTMFSPLLGFGVAAMSQFFPLALGLGLTRREFLAGTSLVFVGTAVFFAAVVAVLKAAESATTGFWVNIRMFDVVYVGTGPAWQTFAQTFLILLATLFVGAALSAVYVRLGATMLWVVLAVPMLLAVIAAGALTIVDDGWIRLWHVVVSTPWAGWMMLLAGLSVIPAAMWVLLVRHASVR